MYCFISGNQGLLKPCFFTAGTALLAASDSRDETIYISGGFYVCRTICTQLSFTLCTMALSQLSSQERTFTQDCWKKKKKQKQKTFKLKAELPDKRRKFTEKFNSGAVF